jgi:hypothetical protein
MGNQTKISEAKVWEDPAAQHDFFGETHLISDVKTIEAEDLEEDGDVVKLSDDEKEQKVIDEQFDKGFGVQSSDEEDEDEDEDEDDPQDKDKDKDKNKTKVLPPTSLSTLNFLKNKGLIEVEIEDGKELSEQEAEDLIEDSWEQSLEDGIATTIKELPDSVKNLIKFVGKGGNPQLFYEKMAQSSFSAISKDSDIDQESVQIAAVTQDLQDQGYDADYISTQIEFLKDSGKLALIGTKAYNKIVAGQEETSSAMAKAQSDAALARKTAIREYKTKITAYIDTLNEAGGFPVSKKDKMTLPEYISEPNVELKDGRHVSEMQAKLFEVMADQSKIVVLAKILQSDFDFSPIARAKATEANRNVREKLTNTTAPAEPKKEEKPKNSRKAVWDYL